jgi:hypothetical protein
MSKVQTEAEIAERLKHCIRKDDDGNVWFAQEYATPILKEWAVQLQQKPDKSDELVVRETILDWLINHHGIDSFSDESELPNGNYEMFPDLEELANGLAATLTRHTAAKIAAAELKTKSALEQCDALRGELRARQSLLEAAEERGWKRGAEAAMKICIEYCSQYEHEGGAYLSGAMSALPLPTYKKEVE